MSTDVTSISSLDPILVAEREQVLIQMLTEAYPTLDFTKGGILEQLIAQPNAVLDVINRTENTNLRNSMSLKTISENPSIADPDIVDEALSNYMISRVAATSATGVIAIVIDTLTTVSIPTTTNFVANGRTFNPILNYLAVTNSALVVEDNNRLVQARPDGKFWFTISVIENVTSGSSIVQGVPFTVDPTPTSFSSAYAAADFAAGAAAQDNAAFIAQLEGGITSKTVSDRKSTSALLTQNFPSISDISIIGYGDFEMSRDRANVFGTGCGSKADIYVRAGALPAISKFTVMAMSIAAIPEAYRSYGGGLNPTTPSPFETTGVNMGTISGASLFEIQLPPTTYPGFIRTEKVTIADPSSLAAALDTTIYEKGDRGVYRPANEQFMPFISTSVQARGSKYQGNATLRFFDAVTQDEYYTALSTILGTLTTLPVWYGGTLHYIPVRDTTGTASNQSTILGSGVQGHLGLVGAGFRFYDVYLSGVTGLTDIQTFVNAREHQAPTADYLVKTSIACFVSADVTIGYRAGTQPPDVSTMQSAVAAAINSVTFEAADLQASMIIDQVSAALAGAGYVIMPITLRGTIYNPDGTLTSMTDQNVLAIPDNSALGVSRRNTSYFAYPSAINVSLKAVTSWSV